ncbi:MAG: DUF3500 domain-containing protein [Alphaproteobacteria bacterium]
MKNLLPITCLIAAVSQTPASAHEAQTHQHAEIVPIPAYTLRYGEAGGNAALQAAQSLLATFGAAEQSEFVFDWASNQREKWSNLPGGMVTRPGLSIGEMSETQRGLLFDLLSSSLGADGYERLGDLLAAEAFLSQAPRASRYGWFPENYWISFYGTPSGNGPWGWQFGGHHLGLNISIRDGQVATMSPTFWGTEPAIFTLNGVDYESVVDMHRSGYAVFQSLKEQQQSAAMTRQVPGDIETGPGRDGRVPDLIGIAARELTLQQRRLLLETIRLWVSIQPDENASTRMAEIEAELDAVHFAWNGTAEVNTPTYMRIQGPSLIIELHSTGGNFGANARGLGHYHTIYRNPTNEYGRRR